MTGKRGGIPPQWEEVFAGRSMRQVAAQAGIYADRVGRFIRGEGVDDSTAEKIADALGITVRKAMELRGEPVREPFTLPAKAQLLSRSQRDAVLRVIDGMLEWQGKAGDLDPPDQASNVVQFRQESLEGDDASSSRGEPYTVNMDGEQDEPPMASRAYETKERRRRRLEGDPGEHPDPDGPEDGA